MTSPRPSPRQQPAAPRGRRRLPLAGLALAALALAVAAYCPGPHVIPLALAKDKYDIKKGEVDRFALDLAAGDYLQVLVEERDVDVKVSLFAPGGAEVVHADGPWGRKYPEELAAVAERRGWHVLEVRALGKGPYGGYRLTRLTPESSRSTPTDRLRVEAVRRTQEALEAPLARQIELQKESIRLWHQVGDRGREAEAFFQLGRIHEDRREFEAAAEAFLKAAGIWHAEHEEKGLSRQAGALRRAGVAYRDAGHLDEARDLLTRARLVARAGRDTETEIDALNGLGRLEVAAGDARAAVKPFLAALELVHGLPEQEVSVLNNLAGAHEVLGEPQKALKRYSRALEIAQGTELAAAVNNRGLLLWSLGDSDLAVQHFRRALELGLPADLRASTLNNLGLAMWSSGEPRNAIAPLEKALQLAEQEGLQEVQVRAAINLSFVRLDLRDLDGAQDMAQQALEAAGGREDLLIQAHVPLAEAYLARGQLDAAREELDRILALIVQRKHVSWTANLTTDLLSARIEHATGARESALSRVRRAITTVESVRAQVVDLDRRATLLASRQSLNEMEIDLLMELGGQAREAEALKASERTHARSLLDALNQAGANVRKGADAALIGRLEGALQQVRLLEDRRLELLQEGGPEVEITEVESQLAAAMAEYESAEDDMVSSSPRYRSLAQPDLLDIGEMQGKLLDGDSLLLEYWLGQEHSYLWAVTRDSVNTFKLPRREEIDAAARSFYELLAPNEGPPEETDAVRQDRLKRAAAELGKRVLGPAAGLLGSKKRLLIVPDGALHYVPFPALEVAPISGGPPAALVERHEVVVLPSASAIAALREEVRGRPVPPELLAIFADPVFEKDDERFGGTAPPAAAQPGGRRRGPTRTTRQEAVVFERLPHTREEAKAIAGLVPGQQPLLDFDASRSKALGGKLARYRYVHFATHGVIDTQRPALSKLVLSLFDRDGNKQDGFLLLANIYNLKLNADMVVLSACDTALGREIRGEGLVGLTRGFMYAGAPRVVASLWSVDDQATAHLMESFYRGILKDRLPPATALRQAQLEVRKVWADPYYWAGFSLQGEWK